jgi:antitoxin component YwqK of YwqJK toxin-antitoxin module
LGADLITKGVHNGIAERQKAALRKNTKASGSRARSAIQGQRPIKELLEGFSKHDIGRATAGRIKYRAESSNLIWEEKKMKKTLLIITSLLFITSTAFPQSKVNVNSLKEYGGKAFKVDDDEPYTGKVFDLNKSTGKKTLQGQYKNGLKTGKWTEYHNNGQKYSEGTFKDGELDGLSTTW